MTIGYNEAMPRTNLRNLNLKTRGFELFMQWQAVNGKHTIDEFAKKVGISPTTARKFIAEPDANIRQAEVGPAWVIAKFFGASFDDFFYQGPDVPENEKPSRFKGYGKRGRPRKEKPSDA